MNLGVLETPPQYLRDRVAAIDQALNLDETALFTNKTGVTTSDISLTALSTPANITVTQGGTAGTTNYTYVVADVGNVGLAPATGVQTTTGNATLTSTNYNTVSWTAITGHTYNIYRSASSGTPSTTGLIGTVTIPLASAPVTGSVGLVGFTVTQTFNDTGISPTGNVPTSNTTGSISVPGPVFLSNTLVQWINAVTLNNASNATWTVAQATAPLLLRTGGSTPTDTTPTAAALVAAFPGVQVGQGIKVTLRNASSGTLTLSAGSGVTITGTTTVTTVFARELFWQFTNVTSGSEAVTLYTGAQAAY